MQTFRLFTVSLLLLAPACDEQKKAPADDELAAPSPVESSAAPTKAAPAKAAPTKAAPEAKPLQGELTAEWLLANPPAATTDPSGALTNWSDVAPVIEKQYGKPTLAEKDRLYWAAMNKHDCVYLIARVQDGKYLLEIDAAARTVKFGNMDYATCLKAAGQSMETLAKTAPIAGDGAKVSVSELLAKFKAAPDDWNTAELTVSGVVGSQGSSTANGVKTFWFDVADVKDPKQTLKCSTQTEPKGIDKGKKIKVQARMTFRHGYSNAKAELDNCIVQ